MRLSGFGLAGVLLPPLNFHVDDPFASQQGRVTSRMIWMYDQPSSEATKIEICRRDTVLKIVNTAISDDIDATNRIWYEVTSDSPTHGYVYSGNIQPVMTILNTASMVDLPTDGSLVEVSVPYTDAHERPDASSQVVFRMYYESTHWIRSVTTDADGRFWYQVYDDKWDKRYYAHAEHLRFMRGEELAPISPEVPDKEKSLQVRLSQQLVIAYEDDKPVFMTPVSTGAIFRGGTYTTPKGSFTTYYKRSSRHMAAGDLTASGFDLPGVPWVQYLTESGISLHGTYWHNDFGRPRSHGCINLSISAAKWLYRWSSPTVPIEKDFSYGKVGTKVEILL